MKSKLFYISFFLWLFIMPKATFAQEYTFKKTKKEKAEEKRQQEHKEAIKKEQNFHKFQNHFFDAIHQKAKEDYNKAIEALEDCKQIYPNDAGMNFEFAKNYFLLKDYENAIFFDEEVLKVKPKNIYTLEHLKQVYRKQNDLKNAIKIQQRIIGIKPERKEALIMLYVSNREKEKAKKVYLELAEQQIYISNATYYKRVLFPKNKASKKLKKPQIKNKSLVKNKTVVANTENKKSKKYVLTHDIKTDSKTIIKETISTPKASGSIKTLQDKFYREKKYYILKKLIDKENNQKKYALLVSDCEKGLNYFPAQTYLYFMQGKGNIKLKKYQDALEVLMAGLDFIIDDSKTKIDFYEQIIKANKGLGNKIAVEKFTKKMAALKK
ncbi:MAG: hypothetical protein V3U80_06705 [Flavobacteriaceae bacterium]